MLDNVAIYADFCKIDEEQRLVFGYASTETRDQQGEIITRDAIAEALPRYLSYPTVREMHQPSAVGTGVEAHMDAKGLYFGAHVVDDNAWKKVKAGVYRGFSMGGKILLRDPVDKSRALKVRLDEISLVDRPANPDAKFDLVKRAGDGVMRMQPVQHWACGIAGHQHTSKLEASACMEQQQQVQQVRMAAGQEYASIDDMRDEARVLHKQHSELAAQHQDSRDRHRWAAGMAKIANDSLSNNFHDMLAKSSDALAQHHIKVAQHYLTLSVTEDVMDGSVQAVLDEAAGAVDSLAKAALLSSSEITGVKVMDRAGAAATNAANQTASSIAALASAVRSHADAAAAIANGDGDKAKHAEQEAHSRMTVAEHHAAASAMFRQMVSQAMTGAGAVVHGKSEDGMGKWGADDKDAAKALIKGMMEKAEAAANEYEKIAKSADEGDMQMAAKAAREQAQGQREFLKALGIIDSKLTDMAELKSLDDKAGDATASPNPTGSGKEQGSMTKAVSNSNLFDIAGSYWNAELDWFGKRNFSDKQRQDAADSGAALPDGSYPIENKTDLSNAIQAVGRSKSPAKAKAHIKARAKALNASDELPEAWKAEMAKAEADEADMEKCDHGSFKRGTCEKCAMAKADADKKCEHGFPMGKCAKCDEVKKAADEEIAKAAKNKKKHGDKNPDDERDDDEDPEDDDEDSEDDNDDDEGMDKNLRKSLRQVRATATSLTALAALHKSAPVAEVSAWADDGRSKLGDAMVSAILAAGDHPFFKRNLARVVQKGGPQQLDWLGIVAKAATAAGAKREAKPDEQSRLYKVAKKLLRMQERAQAAFKAVTGGGVPTIDVLMRGVATKADTNGQGSGDAMTENKPTDNNNAGMLKAAEERDAALKALRTLTAQVAPFSRTMTDLRAQLDASNTAMLEMQARLAKVESTPMPTATTVVPPGLTAVAKENDGTIAKVGNATVDENADGGLLKRVLAMPAGREKQKELLRLANQGRA